MKYQSCYKRLISLFILIYLTQNRFMIIMFIAKEAVIVRLSSCSYTYLSIMHCYYSLMTPL